MTQRAEDEISKQFEKFSYSVTVSVLNAPWVAATIREEKEPSSVLLEEGIRDVIAGKRVKLRR
jgi:hypothetical protein